MFASKFGRCCFFIAVNLGIFGGCGLGPRINDITTNLPAPAYHKIAELNADRNYEYNELNFEKQTAYYKNLKPLEFAAKSPAQVFEAALGVAKAMSSWEIVANDSQALRIEATATTPLLRFRDDVVIEIRAEGSDLVKVAMRSKSRLGKSDFGANAKRIQTYFEGLSSRLAHSP